MQSRTPEDDERDWNPRPCMSQFQVNDWNFCVDPDVPTVKWSWDNPAALAKVVLTYRPKKAVATSIAATTSSEIVTLKPIVSGRDESLVDKAAAKVVAEAAPHISAMASQMQLEIVAEGLEEQANAVNRLAAFLSPNSQASVELHSVDRDWECMPAGPDMKTASRATLVLAYMLSGEENASQDEHMPCSGVPEDPSDIVAACFSKSGNSAMFEQCDYIAAHGIATSYYTSEIRKHLFPQDLPTYLCAHTFVDYMTTYPEFCVTMNVDGTHVLCSPYHNFRLLADFTPAEAHKVTPLLRDFMGPLYNYQHMTDQEERVFSAITYDRVVLCKRGRLVLASNRTSIVWAPVERRAKLLEIAADLRDALNQKLSSIVVPDPNPSGHFLASALLQAWNSTKLADYNLVDAFSALLHNHEEPLMHTTTIKRTPMDNTTVRYPHTPMQAYSLISEITASQHYVDGEYATAVLSSNVLAYHLSMLQQHLKGNMWQYYRLRNIDSGYGALPLAVIRRIECDRIQEKCHAYFGPKTVHFLVDNDRDKHTLSAFSVRDSRYQTVPPSDDIVVVDMRYPELATVEAVVDWIKEHLDYKFSCFPLPLLIPFRSLAEVAAHFTVSADFMLFDSVQPLSHPMFCCMRTDKKASSYAKRYLEDSVVQRCSFLSMCARAMLVAMIGGDRLTSLPGWSKTMFGRVSWKKRCRPDHPDRTFYVYSPYTAASHGPHDSDSHTEYVWSPNDSSVYRWEANTARAHQMEQDHRFALRDRPKPIPLPTDEDYQSDDDVDPDDDNTDGISPPPSEEVD